MQDRNQLLKLDISVFEKNGKSEFAQLVKKNKLRTTQALNDFLIGIFQDKIFPGPILVVFVHYLIEKIFHLILYFQFGGS